jgi:hypothetical protein
MAISRMQEPRQLYGLGSIVKKAVRGVKKIAKSPLGKVALGGALAFGLPGTQFGGLLGRASFGGPASSIFGKSGGVGALFNQGRSALANRFAPKAIGVDKFGNKILERKAPGFFSKLNPFGQNFDAKTAFLTGGAGLVAAPFLMDAFAPEEVEEEVEDVMDVGAIRQSARDYYMGTGGKNLAFMPQKQYVQSNFYAADGGRAGYANGMMVEDEEEEFIRSGAGMSRRQPKAFLNMGGGAGQAQAEQMLMAEFVKYKNKGGTLSFEQFVKAVMQQQQAPEGAGMEQPQPVMMAANGGPVPGSEVAGYTTPAGYNKFDYRSGGVPVRVGAQKGGIMETEEASEMIDMGGMEKDYRETGGFVEMGGKERADDVPARLSKNEFVFTADAVRNAGGGDIDKGAEVMENLMNNLEQGGEVSEDSQGLEGAQAMYEQQQMLQSRMI